MDRAARRARGGQRCASSPGMQTTVPFPMVLRYSRGVLASTAAAAPAAAASVGLALASAAVDLAATASSVSLALAAASVGLALAAATVGLALASAAVGLAVARRREYPSTQRHQKRKCRRASLGT